MRHPPGHIPAVPDHLVAAIAGISPAPFPGPDGQPTRAEWAFQVRRVATQIWTAAWVEAWHAGAAHAMEIARRPVVLTVDPAQMQSLRGLLMDDTARHPSMVTDQYECQEKRAETDPPRSQRSTP